MIFFENNHVFEKPTVRYVAKISVQDTDTLGAAAQFHIPCCLNFASAESPGGGYECVKDLPMPIKTQEEDLFRRSNLPSLMDTPEVRSFYPLEGLKSVYCPKVIVSKDKCLNPIDSFEIAVVSMPAVINPIGYSMVSSKIERILNIASDHKDLILGAWGCGVFNNDPCKLASLFREWLKKYDGVFENVVFAIPKGINHDVFKEYLSHTEN